MLGIGMGRWCAGAAMPLLSSLLGERDHAHSDALHSGCTSNHLPLISRWGLCFTRGNRGCQEEIVDHMFN